MCGNLFLCVVGDQCQPSLVLVSCVHLQPLQTQIAPAGW